MQRDICSGSAEVRYDMHQSFFDLIGGLTTVVPGEKLSQAQQRVFRGVAIVGSSCAGKTTIVQEVRMSSLAGTEKVSVPLRYITRPQRDNDLAVENAYLSHNEFMGKVQHSEICFYWKKRFEPGREELFGFGPTQAGALPVYSGNNGLLYNTGSVYPCGILDDIFFVGIYAPDEVRRERLFMRSPDLARNNPQEVRYRLGDSSEKIMAHVHVVINNYGSSMRSVCQDVVELLRRMVDLFG